jgi:hypothetical protein
MNSPRIDANERRTRRLGKLDLVAGGLLVYVYIGYVLRRPSSLQSTILVFSGWEKFRRRLLRRAFEDHEHLSDN